MNHASTRCTPATVPFNQSGLECGTTKSTPNKPAPPPQPTTATPGNLAGPQQEHGAGPASPGRSGLTSPWRGCRLHHQPHHDWRRFLNATSVFALPPPAKPPESTQTWTSSQSLPPLRSRPLRTQVIGRTAALPARNPRVAVACPVCLSCSSEESLVYAHKMLACCLALL